ncbi:hypothetical protein AB3N59_04485 [Leptospira sp. WS92.C1]
MFLIGFIRVSIFTGAILIFCFVSVSCGKKNKGNSKKEDSKIASSKKKNDLELEPELKERKFFQEDALGQPKKYEEPREAPDSDRESPEPKKQKSIASYLGSSPGCKTGNCKNGNGIYVYESGEVYSGNFKNDKRHGSGMIQYRDGDRYVGNFLNDKKVGVGKYQFSNGAVFNGRFMEDGESAEGFLTVGKKRKECSIIRNKLNCHG